MEKFPLKINFLMLKIRKKLTEMDKYKVFSHINICWPFMWARLES